MAKIKFSNLEISEAMKIVDKTLIKFNGKNFLPGITEENIQSRLRGLQNLRTRLISILSSTLPFWFSNNIQTKNIGCR